MAVSSRKQFKLNDSATFYIRKYEPFLSLEILGDLQTKFLSPMAALLEGNDSNSNEDVKMKHIFDGIERLSKTLDGKSLVQLSKMVLNGDYISVEINNEPAERLTENLVNRSIENVGELFELILEVLKLNYTEVFTLAMSRIGAVRDPTIRN